MAFDWSLRTIFDLRNYVMMSKGRYILNKHWEGTIELVYITAEIPTSELDEKIEKSL